jgi:hypothetical protein
MMPGELMSIDAYVAPRRRAARAVVGVALMLALQGGLWRATLDRAGFVEDDYCWLDDARRSATDPAHVFTLHISGFLRPLTHAVFAVNYAAGGLDPAGYYAVNLGLDLACTALLALLAWRMGLSWAGCVTVAAAFAAHRSHAGVLAWIAGRTSSLWVAAALVCLIAWVQARRTASPMGQRAWFLLALVAHAAALLAKEEAVVVLPAMMLIDRLFGARRDESATETAVDAAAASECERRRGGAPHVLAHMALWGTWLTVEVMTQSGNPLIRQGDYGISAHTLGNAIARLAGLMWPTRIEDWSVAAGMLSGACVLTAATLVGGANGVRRRVALFGALLAMLFLAPTSLFHADAVWASRYAFAPAIGLALVWGAVVDASHARWRRCGSSAGRFGDRGGGRRRTRGAMHGLVIAGLAAFVVAQGLRQHSGMQRWNDRATRQGRIFDAMRASDALRSAVGSEGVGVCVRNSPMELTHLRSAIRLATGIDAGRVVIRDGSSADEFRGADTAVVYVVWDESACAFRTDETADPTHHDPHADLPGDLIHSDVLDASARLRR